MRSFLFFALICVIAFTGCTGKQDKTIENIKLGIMKETTASAKYAAYGQNAWVEGLDTIAKLFEAASKAEEIHAYNHTLVLKSFKVDMDEFTPEFTVRSTAENLKESLEGETYEVNVMYPMFISDATTKKLKNATIESLTWALETEKKHVEMFNKALYALNNNSEYGLPFDYLVCPVCGNTFDKENLPEKCGLCSASKELFLKIE